MTDYIKLFKSRVPEDIQKSFCGAKWHMPTVWLGQGTVSSCHHTPMQKIDVHELAHNPAALTNAPHIKKSRQQMLAGERPSECQYCWRIEDLNQGLVSDRFFKSADSFDENFDTILNGPWDSDVNPNYVEIAFDRVCNLACSYCGPSFSTSWAKDIKKHGPYALATTTAYNTDGSEVHIDEESNPFIEAFWKWWPELSKTIRTIRLTGGEPLMSKHTWNLIEEVKKIERPVVFSINTNLICKEDIFEEFIDAVRGVQRLELYTSCEAYGEHADYIRDGFEYGMWLTHVNGILAKTNAAVTIMTTINALSLHTMTEFFDDLLKLKEVYGKERIRFSINVLRYPIFMTPLMLPQEMRDELSAHYEQWLSANSASLTSHERVQMERFIVYVKDAEKVPAALGKEQQMKEDFRRFYEEYDRRRGKSFEATFPHLVDWYRN